VSAAGLERLLIFPGTQLALELVEVGTTQEKAAIWAKEFAMILLKCR
jgi:hypothetical protein